MPEIIKRPQPEGKILRNIDKDACKKASNKLLPAEEDPPRTGRPHRRARRGADCGGAALPPRLSAWRMARQKHELSASLAETLSDDRPNAVKGFSSPARFAQAPRRAAKSPPSDNPRSPVRICGSGSTHVVRRFAPQKVNLRAGRLDRPSSRTCAPQISGASSARSRRDPNRACWATGLRIAWSKTPTCCSPNPPESDGELKPFYCMSDESLQQGTQASSIYEEPHPQGRQEDYLGIRRPRTRLPQVSCPP